MQNTTLERLDEEGNRLVFTFPKIHEKQLSDMMARYVHDPKEEGAFDADGKKVYFLQAATHVNCWPLTITERDVQSVELLDRVFLLRDKIPAEQEKIEKQEF